VAALADRVRAMIAQPAQEWPVIAAESGSITDVLRGYVVPLALIGPVLSLAGAVIFSHESVLVAMTAAVLEFILEIVAVFVVAFIAAAVAPSFGGTADRLAAFKWVAYSSTARFVAGIFLVLPVFGRLIVLVASLYSLYTLYLGTVPVMRVATEKAAGFTIVVVLVYIVAIAIVTFLVTALLALFFASAAIATGGLAR
jgi:hypothetical protein